MVPGWLLQRIAWTRASWARESMAGYRSRPPPRGPAPRTVFRFRRPAALLLPANGRHPGKQRTVWAWRLAPVCPHAIAVAIPIAYTAVAPRPLRRGSRASAEGIFACSSLDHCVYNDPRRAPE